MRKICPKDSAHNIGVNIEDTFCNSCGTKLIEYDKECQCGKDLSIWDKFCPSCGRPAK